MALAFVFDKSLCARIREKFSATVKFREILQSGISSARCNLDSQVQICSRKEAAQKTNPDSPGCEDFSEG